MKTKEKYTSKSYRLTRDVAPLTFMLPSRNTKRYPLLWFDEDKGINRPLRYAHNQKTPFEDEQDGNAIVEPIIFEEVLGKVAGNVMTWMKSSSNSKDWNLTIILKKDEEYEYYLSLSETGEWMQFRTKITEENENG